MCVLARVKLGMYAYIHMRLKVFIIFVFYELSFVLKIIRKLNICNKLYLLWDIYII